MRFVLFLSPALLLALAACDGKPPAPRSQADTTAVAQADSGAAPAAQQPGSDGRRWLIAPSGPGEITAATTEAELIARHGAANVQRAEVALVEGETAPGTVLFPGDSTRRLEIVWHDADARARPQLVTLFGRESRWAVAPGVSLGTTLAELEAMNGRPFTFSGLSWDYGGLIQSWQGGRLESLSRGTPRVLPRLSLPDDVQATDAEHGRISGDRELRSDDPLLRRLNPRVDEITLSFDAP